MLEEVHCYLGRDKSGYHWIEGRWENPKCFLVSEILLLVVKFGLILTFFQPERASNFRIHNPLRTCYDVEIKTSYTHSTCFSEEKKLECDDTDNGRILLSICFFPLYG